MTSNETKNDLLRSSDSELPNSKMTIPAGMVFMFCSMRGIHTFDYSQE